MSEKSFHVQKQGALLCLTCKSVYMRTPVKLNKTTVYRNQEKMLCSDCDSAIENFFKTGEVKHRCNICGDFETCREVRSTLEAKNLHQQTLERKEKTVREEKCETVNVRKPKATSKVRAFRTIEKVICKEAT